MSFTTKMVEIYKQTNFLQPIRSHASIAARPEAVPALRKSVPTWRGVSSTRGLTEQAAGFVDKIYKPGGAASGPQAVVCQPRYSPYTVVVNGGMALCFQSFPLPSWIITPPVFNSDKFGKYAGLSFQPLELIIIIGLQYQIQTSSGYIPRLSWVLPHS